MRKSILVSIAVLAGGFATYCGSSDSTTTSSTCTQSLNTSDSGTSTAGLSGSCSLLTRDTSSCYTTRIAAGFSATNDANTWLKFSCRVSLTLSGGNVIIVTDSQPDYKSVYYSSSSGCYVAQTTTYPDPNTVSAQSMTLTVPYAPTSSAGAAMGMGTVGIAINGVAIFNPIAAGTDNIYDEAGSFDYCQGHPQNSNLYHYHSEPYAISSNDSNLIGVMRDGYFIYGRKDSDGTTASSSSSMGTWLTATGGHVGVPPAGGASIFHYHAHTQTGNNTAGQSRTVFFLSGNGTTTSANYRGTAGACTGC